MRVAKLERVHRSGLAELVGSQRVRLLHEEKLRDAIEATKDFVGVSGIYRMSATDHMGLDVSAFRMVEIKDGKFVEVR